jgi:hypothetical protein
MREAMDRCRGRADLSKRLVLMHSQLLLQRGNVDGALAVLAQVPPDEPNYQVNFRNIFRFTFFIRSFESDFQNLSGFRNSFSFRFIRKFSQYEFGN